MKADEADKLDMLINFLPLPRINKMVEAKPQYAIFSTFDLKSVYHQTSIVDHEKPYTATEACGNLYQSRRIPLGLTNSVACFHRNNDEILRVESNKNAFSYNITACACTKTDHNENLGLLLKAVWCYL